MNSVTCKRQPAIGKGELSRKLLLLKHRRAFSLLELLAVLAIIGVVISAAVAVFFSSAQNTKRNACYVNKGEIAVQAQLWFRNKGSWPANDLSDIGIDTGYFPAGLPVCPVDGSSYTIDANSHEVVFHTH